MEIIRVKKLRFRRKSDKKLTNKYTDKKMRFQNETSKHYSEI